MKVKSGEFAIFHSLNLECPNLMRLLDLYATGLPGVMGCYVPPAGGLLWGHGPMRSDVDFLTCSTFRLPPGFLEGREFTGPTGGGCGWRKPTIEIKSESSRGRSVRVSAGWGTPTPRCAIPGGRVDELITDAREAFGNHSPTPSGFAPPSRDIAFSGRRSPHETCGSAIRTENTGLQGVIYAGILTTEFCWLDAGLLIG